LQGVLRRSLHAAPRDRRERARHPAFALIVAGVT
jgi:hypothetical protein